MSDAANPGVGIESVSGLIRALAQALVDDVEAVDVQVASDQAGISIRLRVASHDLGKVIGKQGRTARSLRTILQAASMKHQERYSLDIETHVPSS